MSVEMYEISCSVCGVVFMITNSFDNRLRHSKNSFYCPNGHSLSYPGETDADKLKRVERYLNNSDTRLFAARRSNSALRGVITKMKRANNQ